MTGDLLALLIFHRDSKGLLLRREKNARGGRIDGSSWPENPAAFS